jgi:hypothetical protein
MGFKGYKHTEEAKRRISEARKARMARDGFLNPPETRAKISAAKLGQPSAISEEGWGRIAEASRERMRERSPELKQKFWEAGHAALRGKTDELCTSWKGDEVGYAGLQQWIARKRGTPRLCEQCGTTTAKRYHWVPISGERKRDLADWQRLCMSCHWKVIGKVPVPPSRLGKRRPNGYKKGRPRKDNGHRFQKGQVPHNKGKAMPEIQGANHPAWKGGVTPEHQKIRCSLPYKRWRMAVFERDHFTCVMCGFRSQYHGRGRCDIRADHIKPFHQYPELRFEVSNGRTLCLACDHKCGWQPWRTTVIQIGATGQLSFG